MKCYTEKIKTKNKKRLGIPQTYSLMMDYLGLTQQNSNLQVMHLLAQYNISAQIILVN